MLESDPSCFVFQLYVNQSWKPGDLLSLNLDFLISKVVTMTGILHCCAEDSVRCGSYEPSCLVESTHLIFK